MYTWLFTTTGEVSIVPMWTLSQIGEQILGVPTQPVFPAASNASTKPNPFPT